MSVEQELLENHRLIEAAEADLWNAEESGDDAAVPVIRKRLDELTALRGRLMNKAAYPKASGG